MWTKNIFFFLFSSSVYFQPKSLLSIIGLLIPRVWNVLQMPWPEALQEGRPCPPIATCQNVGQHCFRSHGLHPLSFICRSCCIYFFFSCTLQILPISLEEREKLNNWTEYSNNWITDREGHVLPPTPPKLVLIEWRSKEVACFIPYRSLSLVLWNPALDTALQILLHTLKEKNHLPQHAGNAYTNADCRLLVCFFFR